MHFQNSRYVRSLIFSGVCLVPFTFSAIAQADVTPLSSAQMMQMVSPTTAAPTAPQYVISPTPVSPLPAPIKDAPNYYPSSSAPASPLATSSTQAAADPAMAELQVRGYFDATPSSSVNGGTSYGVDTVLYSAPIHDWRIFAGEYYSHEIEPQGEGVIGYSRTMAGAEYHSDNLLAEFAPTYNHFNGEERVGAMGDATFAVDDNWAVGGGAQYFSRDIPLRALNAGITANAYDANAVWDEAQKRNLRLDANVMTFSDDNFRSALAGAYTEHIFDSRKFAIDGLLNLTESQNTKDNNRLYYNPDHDLQGMFGARVTQPLVTKSNLLYEHSLEVTPGAYWQESYGSSLAFNAKYEQRVHLSRTFEGGVALDYARQDYDGEGQNDLAVLFDLTQRF